MLADGQIGVDALLPVVTVLKRVGENVKGEIVVKILVRQKIVYNMTVLAGGQLGVDVLLLLVLVAKVLKNVSDHVMEVIVVVV